MDRLHADSKIGQEASLYGMSHNPLNITSVLVNNVSLILFIYSIKIVIKYLKTKTIKNNILLFAMSNKDICNQYPFSA